MEPTCFYEPDGAVDRFRATVWTRGPWSLGHQHGGPPAALLARTVEAACSDRAFAVVRFTVEYLRPVPIGRLRVEVEPLKQGRMVERHAARLWSGETLLLTATALCVRRREVFPAAAAGGADAAPGPRDGGVVRVSLLPGPARLPSCRRRSLCVWRVGSA